MKKQSWLVSVCFLALLFCGFLGLLLGQDKDFSETENRGLQTRPVFTVASFLSGEYSKRMNAHFGDQLPMREGLVELKGMMELGMGKGENNGILLGRDLRLARGCGKVLCANGELLSDCDYIDPEEVALACRGIQRAWQSLGDRFTVVLTGRSIDVESSAFSYPNSQGLALEAQLEQELEGVPRAEVISLLRDRFEAGEEVYFRTDHHWTALGAYRAYEEIMRSMGRAEEILPMSAFTVQTVSNTFYGSLWSAAGVGWIPPDSLELWLLGNESDFTVTADGRCLRGFYAMEWLSRKDHYSAFLDGTHDVVTVEKTGEARPRLLLLKDSFANSLAPFLAQHFDLVLLNLSSSRRDFTDLSHEVEAWDADACLLVYTLENLISCDKLSRLK